MLIDQFEEVFTDCRKPEERQAFFEALAHLFLHAVPSQMDAEEEGCLRLAITIRSDFEWQLEASEFGQFLLAESRGAYYNIFRLPAMGLDQLRAALTGPAEEEIFQFEAGLVDQILKDLNYAPAALPLLSFSMQKLFQLTVAKGGTDKLGEPIRLFTKHLYADEKEGLGGVSGALRGSADQLYQSLGEVDIATESEAAQATIAIPETPQQQTLRKIILRLINLSEGVATRRRVYHSATGRTDFWSELDYANDQDDAIVKEVLEKLEDAQLVIQGQDLGNGQEYIELAHDSLITHWPTSLQWMQEIGQDNLILQRHLWQAVLDDKKRQAHHDVQANKAKKDSNLSTKTSTLWDQNPKLIQTISAVLAAGTELLQSSEPTALHKAIKRLEKKLVG